MTRGLYEEIFAQFEGLEDGEEDEESKDDDNPMMEKSKKRKKKSATTTTTSTTLWTTSNQFWSHSTPNLDNSRFKYCILANYIVCNLHCP